MGILKLNEPRMFSMKTGKEMTTYTNGDCDFYHDCLDGEDVGGEGGCLDCVHNLEEK